MTKSLPGATVGATLRSRKGQLADLALKVERVTAHEALLARLRGGGRGTLDAGSIGCSGAPEDCGGGGGFGRPAV